MLLKPKKNKYLKLQKRRFLRGIEENSIDLKFGYFGLKSLEYAKIDGAQLMACRNYISKQIKKRIHTINRVWIRKFPHIAVTSKPAEVRMGKGKGNPLRWITCIKPGMILFEVRGINIQLVKSILMYASRKLAIKTIFISRDIKRDF